MVNDILMEYVGWANYKYVAYWNSDSTSFTPRFYGLKGVVDICRGWVVNVASPDLYPRPVWVD
jgi:hypothetical protein